MTETTVDSTELWFHRFPGAPTPRVRLFCLPHAGGTAAAFQGWPALLGPDIELFAATLPGRGARLFDPPVAELDRLADILAEAVATAAAGAPFALLGHSLGALLAFEITRSLRRAGLPAPCSLWVCGDEGPQTRHVDRVLHTLPDAELVEALRAYGGTPAELLANGEMMELLLPGIRADFALNERYVYRPERPLEVPIHVLRGDRDSLVDGARAAGWALDGAAAVHEHVYPGEHFFVYEHAADIAALVAAELAAEMVES